MTEKIALVTGASRGLGAALALELSRTHHVVAVARTTGGLEELDDRIQAAGGKATLAPMDITNADAMAHLCRSIYDRWGKLDFWAHAAIHAAPLTPAAHLDAKDWDQSILVNTTTTGKLIPMVAPLLSAGATALFFEDDHAGEKFFSAYGASKAAQMALVRSWAAEATSDGPTIAIASPAPMPTATRARFFPGEDRAPLADPNAEAVRILSELGQRNRPLN